MRKLTIPIMVLLLLATPMFVSAADIPRGYGCETSDPTGALACTCEATLLNAYYNSEVNPGESARIVATFKLLAGNLDRCRFLLESSILPTTSTLSVISATGPICCVENDNYAAAYYTLDNLYGVGQKTEEVTVNFYLNAPTQSSIDHCADYYRTYWAGQGYYDVAFGVYNGCKKDVGSKLKTILYNRNNKIYVEVPDSCGNGVCEPNYGETPEMCPEDCVDTCGIPGCQMPNDPIYCPEQCKDGYVCSSANCPFPFYMCAGNACVLNYTTIYVIIGTITGVVIVGVYLKRRK